MRPKYQRQGQLIHELIYLASYFSSIQKSSTQNTLASSPPENHLNVINVNKERKNHLHYRRLLKSGSYACLYQYYLLLQNCMMPCGRIFSHITVLPYHLTNYSISNTLPYTTHHVLYTPRYVQYTPHHLLYTPHHTTNSHTYCPIFIIPWIISL